MVEAATGDEAAPEGSYLDENENGGSGRTLRDMSPATARREFELAVQFAMPAIEEAACLERRDGRQTRTNSHGELSLSFDDWFKLRGLLLRARFARRGEVATRLRLPRVAALAGMEGAGPPRALRGAVAIYRGG